MYKYMYYKCKWKLKKQSRTIKRLRRIKDAYKREIIRLRKRKTVLEDGYVVEWCPCCETQITMLWDVEEQGRSAFCPVCGERLMLCETCDGECDYDYGMDVCKEM